MSRAEHPVTNAARRRFLALGGAAVGGALVASRSPSLQAIQTGEPLYLGDPVSAYGERSRFETVTRLARAARYPEAAGSLTPLQDLYGTITPSALHFERHHAGVPEIDPSTHKLMIHGMVERPLVFTLDELRRLPSVSRVHFVECSGNGRPQWRPSVETTLQQAYGMTSCSEWTGVPLSVLLREAGVRPEAAWVVAEGADACRLTRSVPLDKANDDVLVAYGQNGEAVRPGQGHPLRLVVPGWEGSINVKWLRRLQLVDKAYMTREETSKYTDLMPDGKARQFTFEMDAKSVITRPGGGQTLQAPGFHEIVGLAWSGRGVIRRVEVTTDGGSTWRDAELQAPVLTKAHTRFRVPWTWTGEETILQSRCTDDTGYVQPSREELTRVRGLTSSYHYNGIQRWRIGPDGSVQNVVA